MAKSIIQFKKMFFDSKEVIAATDKAARSVLSKIGAFIRREAKSSIKPGGSKHKASLPGEPPRSQTGLLKRFIFFGYDTSTQSVVVGPAKLGGVKGKDAPHTLEYGGKAAISHQLSAFSSKKSVNIAPRPYMGPALNKNLPKLPAMWANSIKK
ncbi:MAG: phage virion morphogenesis protein [Sedimentisphaerales bacterium]